MRFAFDKVLSVYRLISSEDDTVESYQLHGQLKGVIMPIKAEDLILSEGNPAKLYKFYADYDVDLKESDKLCDEQAEYIVKNVRRLEFRALSHTEAIIYKPNS